MGNILIGNVEHRTMSSVENEKRFALVTADELLKDYIQASVDMPNHGFRISNHPDAWKRSPQKSLVKNFKEIGNIDSRLWHLVQEAREYRQVSRRDRRKGICANNRFYGGGAFYDRGLKPRLIKLAGWEAENTLLKSSDAYDVAYEYIYSQLPNCRGCGCF
jgi:hypothetical protein